MKSIFFSVITVTHNRASSGFLHECIESVQSQKCDSFSYEHIIIDDGSTDNTEEVVEKYASTDSRIKYYKQQNIGLAHSLKNAIQKASGKYLFKLDDDDLMTEGALLARYQYIVNNKDIDWFYAKAEWIDDYGLPTEQLYQSQFFEDYAYERMLISNYIHGGTETIKTEVAKAIVWPEWLVWSQDYFLWLELLRPEKRLRYGFHEDIVMLYRYHTSSYTTSINSSTDKKRQKEELNNKIRSELHPDSLAFLANKAYEWSSEAIRTNEYWARQFNARVAPLEKRIAELESQNNSFVASRVIGPIIKAREFKHKRVGSVRSIPVRVVNKISNKIKINKKEIQYLLIDKKKHQSEKPLVSVVTPFYNRKDTMPETIRSVLGQTFQDFEYIIVNDGSTEIESVEYLKRIAHPKIKVIHQDNAGVAEARNTGIKNSNGKYILCLDSDDIIEPTYIEKAIAVLETDPEVDLVTYDSKMFGAINDFYFYKSYDPMKLLEENLVLTAAVFKKKAWEEVGGYKNEIGYEDWEFWVNLAEHGYFGKHIPESIFNYRTAEISRYVDDQETHHENTAYIKNTHPDYYTKVRKHKESREHLRKYHKLSEALMNLSDAKSYRADSTNNPKILIAIPWMTFGGAETLIYNFCKEIANDYAVSFVTGLKASNEWEYKFKEISKNIYHLANLFDDQKLYLEFISNYISTRGVEVLHIIHTSFVFEMLPEIKKRHPGLKVAVTVFNDKAHFNESTEYGDFIDVYTSDNQYVCSKYKSILKEKGAGSEVKLIPNGINSDKVFSLSNHDRNAERQKLGIKTDDLAVFFVGRLSEEKNPDVFLAAAKEILSKDRKTNVRFFMIGDGVMGDSLYREIREFNSGKLKYLGYQSDIAKYLSAADVFVLPSSTEGFPLSILEAMAMNVVVVASRVGAIPDVIVNGVDGYVISPGSKEEIIECIEKLRVDIKLMKKMKKLAREKVETKYSNTILGNNYRKLYNKLLK
jgi:glycosyltransferase involved in cell wall biosynthesis